MTLMGGGLHINLLLRCSRRILQPQPTRLNSIWWWISSSGDLLNVEFPFIDITPRSTLTWSNSSYKGFIYGSKQIPLLDPNRYYHLRVCVDLGVIAMKEYNTFYKAPELESRHQIQFIGISSILVGGILPPCGQTVGVFYSSGRLGICVCVCLCVCKS